MNLTPVDFDPFDESAPRLTPVDFDPFEGDVVPEKTDGWGNVLGKSAQNVGYLVGQNVGGEMRNIGDAREIERGELMDALNSLQMDTTVADDGIAQKIISIFDQGESFGKVTDASLYGDVSPDVGDMIRGKDYQGAYQALLNKTHDEPVNQSDPINMAREVVGETGESVADYWNEKYQDNQVEVDPWSAKGVANAAIEGAGSSFVPAALITAGTKNPIAGVAAMASAVHGRLYDNNIRAGMSPYESADKAAYETATEALPELIPLGIITKEGGGLLMNLFKSGTAESIQEMFTELLNIARESMVEGKTPDQNQLVDRVAYAGTVGGVSGVGTRVITQPFIQKPVDEPNSPEPTKEQATEQPTLTPVDFNPFEETVATTDPNLAENVSEALKGEPTMEDRLRSGIHRQVKDSDYTKAETLRDQEVEQQKDQDYDAALEQSTNQELDLQTRISNINDGQNSKQPTAMELAFQQAQNKTQNKNESKYKAGDFGPVYDDVSGDYNAAVQRLSETKTGEVPDALFNKDVGSIDLVWGKEGTPEKNYEDGYGLSKIIKKHPEVVSTLSEIIEQSVEVRRSDNRVILETPDHKSVVRLNWDKKEKAWLLTSFVSNTESASDTGSTGVDVGTVSEPPSDQVADPVSNDIPATTEIKQAEPVAQDENLYKGVGKREETTGKQKEPETNQELDEKLKKNGRRAISWNNLPDHVRTDWAKEAGLTSKEAKQVAGEKWGRIPEGGTRAKLEAMLDKKHAHHENLRLSDSEQSEKTTKIEDVGEKIGGARKDMWSGFREKIGADVSDDEILKLPLSKVFPEPDYEKLLKDGVTKDQVIAIKVLRDMVPRKPTSRGYSYKRKEYVTLVKGMKRIVERVIDGEVQPHRIYRVAADISTDLGNKLNSAFELYRDAGFPDAPAPKGYTISYHHYTIFRGEKDVSKYELQNNNKSGGFGGMRNMQHFDSYEEAVDALKEQLKNSPEKKGKKTTEFKVYRYRNDGHGWRIGKKNGRNYIDVKDGFDEAADARKYIKENQSELEEKLAKLKEIPAHRRSTNEARLGEDYRGGKDVGAEEFRDTFGFRGVEFGNWVEQEKRQNDINDAYDGLMDLAKILDIPPKSISLNSELGIAFGARGRGGKSAPKAHYEPGKIVINLTKKDGAGSLAHEWFHGLDNYFSRMRGERSSYLTDRPYELMDKSVRKEMVARFKEVMTAIKGSDLPKRAAVLDGRKSKPYWATDVEMAARSFESYVIGRLSDNDVSNDYLANIVSPEYWDAAEALGLESDNSYPYILEGEQEPVYKAFDEFFETIETKETDKGVALFSSIKVEQNDTGNPVPEKVKNIRKAIASTRLKWRNAPIVEVVEKFDDVPDHIRDQAGKGTHNGVYDTATNRIYLVAENIHSIEQAKKVLAHEAVGHFGMEEMLGDEYRNILDKVQLLKDSDNPRIAKIVDEVHERYGELDEDAESAEIIAVMAEKGVKHPIIKRVIEAVRAFLRKIGFSMQFTYQELEAMLAKAGRHLEKEGVRKKETNGRARFSKTAEATTSFTVPDETLKDRVARKIQDKFQRLYKTQQAIEDQTEDIRIDTDSDAYAAEERMHGKIEYEFNQLEHDYIEPMADALAESGIPVEVLDEYLIARHAPERNKHIASIRDDMPDGGSGMSTSDANKMVQKLEKQHPNIKQAAQKVYDMLEHKRDILRNQDLAGDELIDSWEQGYQHYVPLKGFAEDSIDEQYPRIGKGLSIKGKESKHALGRQSMAYSPVTQTISDVTESIIRARKNEVGLHFLALVEDSPNPEFWQIFTEGNPDQESRMVSGKVVNRPVSMHNNPNYFGVKRDGKQYYVKLYDQRLAQAMQNLGVEKQNVLIRVGGAINRFLSSMNTSLNPEFVISNFSRDIQTAIYNVLAEQDLHSGKAEGEKIAAKVVKDVFPAMRSIFRELNGKEHQNEFDEYARDFIADGAKTGFFDMKDLEAQKRHIETLITIRKGGAAGKAIDVAQSLGKFVENVNGAVENAVRLSAYIHLRKTLEAKGVSESVARKRAASLAKNLTVNFNRRGEWSTLSNSLYMFFNASVQGTAQFARTVLTMKNQNGKRTLNMAQKAAAGMVLFAYVLAHINRAASDDDDDDEKFYDKIPGHIKERNLILMKSIVGGNGKDYYKIPLPYGYNIFHVLGTTVNDTAHGSKKLSEGVTDITMALLGSFNPVGISESDDPGTAAIKTITPTVLTPGVEIIANENFFGGPVYREDKFNDRTPDSSMAFRTTKAHYIKTAQWLNKVTGGSMQEKGKIDVSPDSLEHWFEFATGGAGRFIDRSIGAAEKLAVGIPLKDREIPFYSKVSGEPNEYDAGHKYYEHRSAVLSKMDVYKALKWGDRREYREDNQTMLRLVNRVKRVDKKLKRLRKRRDRALSKEGVSKKRQHQIKEKYMQDANKKYSEFNKKWNQLIENAD